ncbi:type IV secretion system protein VirB8 [Rhodanobacter sp. K2T2]|uniref:virB8 family protein n=1 Tax=Rhodanobacter sp. K2T2 TaxID=2723085 RepID=UPI0015CBF7EF|nr:type IV secretion system protein [Rhodanobacter sp. K2T2]NYE28492.1 type IV secretion system protein VirB8 [Rhodanobacter sp. K2T2]
MADKKTNTRKIDDTVKRSVSFELTVADLAKRSERRAWWVAFSAVVVALILLGGYFYMLPLKEKVPYIVMADAYTGTSTVARLTQSLTDSQITPSEAINRSNVAHFVLARESYDIPMMNLHDWPTVLTMASPGVGGAYQNLYASNNPDNPFKTLGRDKAIRVKILSIVLTSGGELNEKPKGATVRFQRSLYDKQSGISRPMDSEIATLTFVYKANLKMDDQYRIENPLGFQVTDYRVDADASVAPPEAVPGALLTAPLAQPGAATSPAPASTSAIPASSVISQPPIPEHEATPSAAAPAAAPATNNISNGVGHR